MAEPGGAGSIGDLLHDKVVLATPQTRHALAGGSGMFLIEPDRAERFIADIRAAADKLRMTKDTLLQARWICSQEADQVSKNAAQQAAGMSDNAANAAERYRVALYRVADTLQANLDAYRQAEQANTMRQP